MNEPAGTMRPLESGLRYLTHERIPEAIEALHEAVADDPEDATAHAFLAAALFADGRPDEADTAIERALAIDPDGYWPHLKAGELRYRLGDIVAAETHFLVALRTVEPGTRESEVAAASLVRARQAEARSIVHRAVMPTAFRRLALRRASPPGYARWRASRGAP